jgi:outer membrane lipoprotein SlyB
MKRLAVAVAFTLAAAGLGACATPDSSSGGYQVSEQRIEHGVVERIDLLRQGQAQPTGLGAVLGGVAGGVIGHQIGSGRGNTAATIAGAIGGGLVGNEVERSSEGDRYRITVRLDGGARLEINEVGEGELREGDRVRVVNNRVYRE